MIVVVGVSYVHIKALQVSVEIARVQRVEVVDNSHQGRVLLLHTEQGCALNMIRP